MYSLICSWSWFFIYFGSSGRSQCGVWQFLSLFIIFSLKCLDCKIVWLKAWTHSIISTGKISLNVSNYTFLCCTNVNHVQDKPKMFSGKRKTCQSNCWDSIMVTDVGCCHHAIEPCLNLGAGFFCVSYSHLWYCLPSGCGETFNCVTCHILTVTTFLQACSDRNLPCLLFK